MDLCAYEQLLALAVLRSRFAEAGRAWTRGPQAAQASRTGSQQATRSRPKPRCRRGGSASAPRAYAQA